VYICLCIYIYIYIHSCICIYIYVYTCVYIYIHIHIHTYIHVYTCKKMCDHIVYNCRHSQMLALQSRCIFNLGVSWFVICVSSLYGSVGADPYRPHSEHRDLYGSGGGLVHAHYEVQGVPSMYSSGGGQRYVYWCVTWCVTWFSSVWYDSLTCIDVWHDSVVCDMNHWCVTWPIGTWHDQTLTSPWYGGPDVIDVY